VAAEVVARDGERVEPVSHYRYDAVYRLIEASGREHIGQCAFDFAPASGDRRDFPFAGLAAHANDLQALRGYTERYDYDLGGNPLVVRHLAGGSGWTREFDYEEASLLEAGVHGNRLTRTTVGNGAPHVEALAYDAHGNATVLPPVSALDWDFQDRLHRAELGGGGTAYYVYDGTGQRVMKVIESLAGVVRKQRIYIGGFELYRELAGDGSTTLARESLHVVDGEQRIALVETRTIAGGAPIAQPEPVVRYQLASHLGSSTVELDADGAVIAYEEYHPYGTTALQAGRSAAEVSLKRYRYTGKERDDETGLAYHGARYYAPWLLRWASADPLGIVDGPNLYAYARGNPVRFSDPRGTDCNEHDSSTCPTGSPPPRSSSRAPRSPPPPTRSRRAARGRRPPPPHRPR